jgi:hypothetical protein
VRLRHRAKVDEQTGNHRVWPGKQLPGEPAHKGVGEPPPRFPTRR